MAKRKGLGRGLDALLGPSPARSDDADRASAGNVEPGVGRDNQKTAGIRQIPVDLIQRGRYQPRIRMDQDALAELAASIRAQGIIQPVVIRPVAGGRYELIAGERRWRAAQLAELESVPAVVREVDDQAALAVALIENIQREDLNPLEEAKALSRLVEEFELTHEAAAQAVGRSRVGVSNLLRLLELGAEASQMLEAGQIEMGHARALLGLHGPGQDVAAREVLAKGLTVRETEALVRRSAMPESTSPAQPGSGAGQREDPNLVRLQDELSERLGAVVRISHRSKGNGRLTIDYASLDELEGVLERIRGPVSVD